MLYDRRFICILREIFVTKYVNFQITNNDDFNVNDAVWKGVWIAGDSPHGCSSSLISPLILFKTSITTPFPLMKEYRHRDI